MYVAGRTGGHHDRRRVRQAIDKLIAAARESGLSDAEMTMVLEDTVEGLDEGLSAA
jgi:hypothetical protein